LASLDSTVLALQILGDRLRREGATELRNELNKTIRAAAQPVLGEIRADLPGHMPTRYAAVLDPDLRLSVTVQTAAARAAGVRITATTRQLGGVQRRRLRRLEGGILAHPLFGNRRHWYDQTSHVKAGFFAGPITGAQPQFRQAVVDAMAATADKLTRRT
jgi:hypothetical protein